MNKLESYLKKNKITQRLISKKVGVTPVTVHYWVIGRSIPTLLMAKKIEKATNGEVSVYDWK